MENELVIEKQHNPILDLSIAYGLFYILTFNSIEATLHNYKSAYVIRHEKILFDDIELFMLDDEWINFGPFLSKSNKDKMLENIFGDSPDKAKQNDNLLTSGVLESVMEYYSTNIAERSMAHMPKSVKKKEKMGAIGTWYGVKGIRGNGVTSNGHSVYLFERWLSEIGFIHACSFMSVDDKADYLFWMGIPSEKGINEIRLFEGTSVDKETGEIKRSQFMNSTSVEIALVETQLKIQSKLLISNIKEQYQGAYFMKGWYNGNTGSCDKVLELSWFPFTEPTIEKTLSYLRYFPSNQDVDLQHALSSWLFKKDRNSFYRFANTLSKANKRISNEEREDYFKMANMEKLHQNLGVETLGKRLSLLMFNKRGYETLVDLMNVHSKEKLMQVISEMSIVYAKASEHKFALWNSEEYESFIALVNDDNYKAKDIASAILLHSQTYQSSKKQTEVEEIA